jgi:hypothetical protein
MTTQRDFNEQFHQMERNYRDSIVKLSERLSIPNLIAALRAELVEYQFSLMAQLVSSTHATAGLIHLQLLHNQFTVQKLVEKRDNITADTAWTPELSSAIYSTGVDIEERARQAYYNDRTMEEPINNLRENLMQFKDEHPGTEYLSSITS